MTTKLNGIKKIKKAMQYMQLYAVVHLLFGAIIITLCVYLCFFSSRNLVL